MPFPCSTGFNSYPMNGALSPEIEEPEASKGENDTNTGSLVVPQKGKAALWHRQSSNTALQAPSADISEEANPAAHDNLPGPTTNRILASHAEQNTDRESPDLYGATPPRARTPDPIAEELGVAIGGSQHATAVASLEDADRENDGRLYSPRHQGAEGDFAIPELMLDTTTPTSVQGPAPALKRQWTKQSFL